MKEPTEGQYHRKVTWEKIDNLIKQLVLEIPEGATIYGIPTNGTIIANKIHEIREDIECIDNDKKLEPWMIVVDDIHDSGETALPYHEKGNIVMTLYSRDIDSKREVDFFVEQISGTDWIVFPWEKE